MPIIFQVGLHQFFIFIFCNKIKENYFCKASNNRKKEIAEKLFTGPV